MKKKKLLENPVVVALLCVVAGAAIYLNAIAPLLKKDRPDEGAAADAPTAITAEELRPPEPSPESATDSTVTTADTASYSGLHRTGWNRTGTRNPFVFIETTRGILSEVASHDSAVVSVAGQRTRSKGRAINPNNGAAGVQRSEKSPLVAISRGSSGLVALIGTQFVCVGDTCDAGVVRWIGLSSVTLQTPRGPRILRLTTSNQGAPQ